MPCRTAAGWCTQFLRNSSTGVGTWHQTDHSTGRTSRLCVLCHRTLNMHKDTACTGGRGGVMLTSAINSWMSTSRNGSATFRHFASRHSYEGREKHSVLIHHQTTMKLDCNCQPTCQTWNTLSSHFSTHSSCLHQWIHCRLLICLKNKFDVGYQLQASTSAS